MKIGLWIYICLFMRVTKSTPLPFAYYTLKCLKKRICQTFVWALVSMIQSTFNMFSYRTQQNHTNLIILINVLSTHCWQGYTRAQRRKSADNSALDQPLLTQCGYSHVAASPSNSQLKHTRLRKEKRFRNHSWTSHHICSHSSLMLKFFFLEFAL